MLHKREDYISLTDMENIITVLIDEGFISIRIIYLIKAPIKGLYLRHFNKEYFMVKGFFYRVTVYCF
jgi:hypothetical protein